MAQDTRIASPETAPAPAEELGLERLRERAESFQTELNRRYYEALAGLRASPGLEEVYARWAELFETARAAEVERALAAADPGSEEARRLEYLLDFVASGLEEEAGKQAEERYLEREATAVVRVAEEEIPFRAVRVRLRNAAERGLRREMAEAALEVSRTLQLWLREGLEAVHAAARGLGGANYVAHRARLSRFDLAFVLRQTDRLLAETEAPYLDLLEWFARRELGLSRRELRSWDLPRLFRGERFDAEFPPEGMVESARRTMAAMGLDLTAGGRVSLDLEPRPTKSARAFCSPIRIPHDVKLVIRPAGGADDYGAFLHELGHALHYGYVEPAAAFEFRVLGDNSITEAYAATFDHLLLLPGWLAEVQGLSAPRDFLLLRWLEELFLLRRYAGKLRYELELHARGPDPALAERYSEELARTTAVEAPGERYLEDVDPRLYCVCYLQAWMLCGLLHRALRERFDSDWYRNPRSGPFLRDLFACGQRDRPAELAERLGAGELGFDALLEWAREGLDGGGAA